MARILIVGGGCRGRLLAGDLVGKGHALRITTREERGRAAIEAAGAECWIGTPDRLGTLRGALENVTLACWLLGSARGNEQQLRALHGSRLKAFVRQLVDTTVRGFVYEAAGSTAAARDLAAGESIARALTEKNAIPMVALAADPAGLTAWLAQARDAVHALLEPPAPGGSSR